MLFLCTFTHHCHHKNTHKNNNKNHMMLPRSKWASQHAAAPPPAALTPPSSRRHLYARLTVCVTRGREDREVWQSERWESFFVIFSYIKGIIYKHNKNIYIDKAIFLMKYGEIIAVFIIVGWYWYWRNILYMTSNKKGKLFAKNYTIVFCVLMVKVKRANEQWRKRKPWNLS